MAQRQPGLFMLKLAFGLPEQMAKINLRMFLDMGHD